MMTFFVIIALLLSMGVRTVMAAEFSGKLERLDRKTVTLLGPDRTRLVLEGDGQSIQKAAAFIGRSVSVKFCVEQGHKKLLLFRPVSTDPPEGE